MLDYDKVEVAEERAKVAIEKRRSQAGADPEAQEYIEEIVPPKPGLAGVKPIGEPAQPGQAPTQKPASQPLGPNPPNIPGPGR